MSRHDTRSLFANSPRLPLAPDAEPVFPEPWAAEAFAMTVLLYDKGLFSWTEWADALSVELRAQDPLKGGSDYFDCWVMALSTILADRRVADAATVLALQRSWQRAAEATPHGVPIELRNDPLRR